MPEAVPGGIDAESISADEESSSKNFLPASHRYTTISSTFKYSFSGKEAVIRLS
jgi:hypothetical protein